MTQIKGNVPGQLFAEPSRSRHPVPPVERRPVLCKRQRRAGRDTTGGSKPRPREPGNSRDVAVTAMG